MAVSSAAEARAQAEAVQTALQVSLRQPCTWPITPALAGMHMAERGLGSIGSDHRRAWHPWNDNAAACKSFTAHQSCGPCITSSQLCSKAAALACWNKARQSMPAICCYVSTG